MKELFNDYFRVLIVPFILTSIYHIYYMSISDPLSKYISTPRKKFSMFIVKRILIFIYCLFIGFFFVFDYIKRSGQAEISYEGLYKSSEFLIIWFVYSFLLYLLGEFLFNLFLKFNYNLSRIPKVCKFYFYSRKITNTNKKIYIIEKDRSNIVMCYYKKNKDFVRLLIPISQLMNIDIHYNKQSSLKTKYKDFKLSFNDLSTKNKAIVFYLLLPIIIFLILYSVLQIFSLHSIDKALFLFKVIIIIIYFIMIIFMLAVIFFLIDSNIFTKEVIFCPFTKIKKLLKSKLSS